MIVSLILILNSIGSMLIFTPYFWFCFACLVYYGYGALLPEYGNFRTIEISEYYFYVDESLQLFTNFLNVWSIAIILFFIAVLDQLEWVKRSSINVNPQFIKAIADRFAFIGVSISLAQRILRLFFGDEYIMPGALNNLVIFMHGALFIYTYLLFKKEPKIIFRFSVLFFYMLFTAVFSFMKQDIIEFAMVVFFGYFLVKPSIKKIMSAALIGILLFPALTLATTFGRIISWENDRTGDYLSTARTIVPVLMDLEILSNEIYDIESSNPGMYEDNPVWRRLSTTSAQAAAVYYSDNGLNGTSFNSIAWILLPRSLFPQKPIVTQGDTFTELVTGDSKAGGTGAGYFAEGYWNFGYGGVLFVCITVSLILVIFSQFSLKIMPIFAFQYFPVLFYGIKTGYRVDDWFVASTVASLPIIGVIFLVCFLLSKKLVIHR